MHISYELFDTAKVSEYNARKKNHIRNYENKYSEYFHVHFLRISGNKVLSTRNKKPLTSLTPTSFYVLY